MALEFQRRTQNDFDQTVHVNGYKIAYVHVVGGIDGRWFYTPDCEQVPVIISRDSTSESRKYNPLALKTDKPIYRTFSELDVADETAILAFINKYGFLLSRCGYNLKKPRRLIEADSEMIAGKCYWFEPLSEIVSNILSIQKLVTCYDALQSTDMRQKVSLMGSFDYYGETIKQLACQPDVYIDSIISNILHEGINEKLEGSVRVYVSNCIEEGEEIVAAPSKLRFEPTNLLSAMFLQFAQDVTGERRWKKCEMCDEWWELGKNPQRATSRKRFCSNNCKVAYWRRDKKQGLSRESAKS